MDLEETAPGVGHTGKGFGDQPGPLTKHRRVAVSALAEAPRVLYVPDESTGEQVTRRLERIGINNQDFAMRAGVHARTLRKIRHDDPSVEAASRAKVLRALDELEHELGLDDPDHVTSYIDLPSGERVTFEGSSDEVAEQVRRFFENRGKT